MDNNTTVKHTPGPWVIVSDDCPSNQFISNEVEGKHTLVICSAPGQELHDSFKNWKTNSKLIAASPDMLLTLERIQVAAELAIHGGSNDLYNFCEMVMANTRPVISKATS